MKPEQSQPEDGYLLSNLITILFPKRVNQEWLPFDPPGETVQSENSLQNQRSDPVRKESGKQ